MEASSAELRVGLRDEHVISMGQTKVCSTGGVDHCAADVTSRSTGEMWSRLFAPTTKWAAAFSSIWSRRVTCADTVLHRGRHCSNRPGWQ